MSARHGTYNGYITDKCRQPCCREAWRLYQAKRARDIAYRGRKVRQRRDPAKAAAYILELRARGIGSRTIAATVGVHEHTVDVIAAGKRLWISDDTERAILSYQTPTLTVLRDRSRLDATGTHRRIRALQAIGWSLTDLAARLGCSGSNIGEILRNGRVRVSTALRIAELYDAMWDQEPPAGFRRTKTLNQAKANGWAPPAAWDDDTIDDPNAQPNLGTKPRRDDMRDPKDTAEDVEWLLTHDPSLTSTQLAHRLGYRDKSGIQQALKRADRPDLLARLAENAEAARPGRVTNRGAA